MDKEKLYRSFEQLKDFCERSHFKGYDPYDGLNSTLFQSIPFMAKSRFFRLAWIQVFKRSPINFRKLTGVKPDYNPKALGLFLSAYCIRYRQSRDESDLAMMRFFTARIMENISPGYSGACWGYNFDWQAKAFFRPKFTPTIVASSFIANALLDAYDLTREEALLTTARSTCDFILKDLNRTAGEEDSFAFSYSPLDNSVVYNASLLGARLLSRVYSFTKEPMLAEKARQTVVFCCRHQKPDGSWSYGTLPFHQWIDNFHTGYNLECLQDYMSFTGDHAFEHNLRSGFDYYIKTFFTQDGVSKYYSNSTYPIDIHAPSQLVITLHKLKQMDAHRPLVEKVLEWTIDHMQSRKGYFYYQINKYVTSRIPYMRWSQAWMFYSLSLYIADINRPQSQTTGTMITNSKNEKV